MTTLFLNCFIDVIIFTIIKSNYVKINRRKNLLNFDKRCKYKKKTVKNSLRKINLIKIQ